MDILKIEKNIDTSKFNIKYFDLVGSTNTVAKEMALSGSGEFTVIIADEQTAGRGKPGRSFVSCGGVGVYLSVILKPSLPLSKIHLITSFASVKVAEAIDKLSGENTKIKWVNDLYLNGKKICGILTESVINPKSCTADCVVLGIGINVLNENFDESIKNIAGSIKTETGLEISREDLIAEILNSLVSFESEILAGDYLNEYRKRSCLLGKEIKVFEGVTSYSAVAQDIDDNAGLVISSGGEIKTLQSGEEVSVRFE